MSPVTMVAPTTRPVTPSTVPLRSLRSSERQTRSDALPEHSDYRDDGCDMFPSCLSCPLARCRYDVPGGLRAILNDERDRQIRVMREDAGLSVDEIADRFQVSRRTVFRALSLGGSGRCGTRGAE